MNDDEAVDLIVGAVLDSLLRRMSERPQLRAAVHHLALRLAEATRPVEEPAGRPAGAEAQAQARPASAPDDPERTAAADAEPLQARADPPPPLATKLLRLGSASMELEVPGSPESTAPAAPARGNAGGPMVPTRDHSSPATLPVGQDESLTLSIVAKRCRLKAEACRWIVSGGRELLQARPPSMREEDLVRRARAFPRCFLWMLHEGARLTSDRGLERIAACYENAGAAAELVSDILHDERRVDDLLPDAMRLLAEAQSALRVALAAAAIDREEDQYAAFRWLRERAERHRIYVERHMRLDDPADPEASDDLEQRLERFRDGFEGWQRCEAERRKLLGKVRYHCKRLAGGDAVDPAEEWRTVLATVASLVEGGLPTSDVGLRDLLLPVMDRLPEEVEPPPAARRVLGEIDAFLDSRPTAQEPARGRGGRRSSRRRSCCGAAWPCSSAVSRTRPPRATSRRCWSWRSSAGSRSAPTAPSPPSRRRSPAPRWRWSSSWPSSRTRTTARACAACAGPTASPASC